MPTVNTVLGPLDTAKLGVTLSHEHVVISSAGIKDVYPDFMGDRNATIEDAVKMLSEAKQGGIDTLVDVSTLDLGRDVALVREVSKRTGVNVIPATGIWRDIPRAFWEAHPEDVAKLFVREITQGIENTGIKAGIIKVATDQGGVTPENEIIIRAAAKASNQTGAPISCHTWALERVGEQQVKIFKDEKVDLNRVYIGHSNDTTDLDYLTGLLKQGVWLGLDRTPGGHHPGVPEWPQRTETIKRLVDAGYANRIMLGHDWSVYPGIIGSPEGRKAFMDTNPDNYLFISRNVLPKLKEMGVGEDIIHQIMIDNPRRFFENKK